MSDKNFSCKSGWVIRLNGGVSSMQERALTLGAYESEREREKKQRERRDENEIEVKKGRKSRKGIQKQDMIRELEKASSRNFLLYFSRACIHKKNNFGHKYYSSLNDTNWSGYNIILSKYFTSRDSLNHVVCF